ncbi:hydroxymyristoyl-ACP dehydratase [Gramella sp. GC03-9]|uniref:Hydroxymyristoyl-ACP dehydratase n=1 Tax=Christiangramia oceanisediminis TaxID=2920386 RepID=A0A9X2KY69_9FLAO|nr:hydroxymyristoyl-ACP dehydratase [Gramella oceanisediminis]MCP9200464.1 hydroxymyristoyl-ACP dehydratase [Gramella oceanisediminis]
MILQEFYELISSKEQDGLLLTTLRINNEHPLYNGHFPNRPVTPGVVLMHLFKEEAMRRTGNELQLVRANNVKFIAVFDPGQTPELLLESKLEVSGEFVKLNGVARTENGIVLKIQALYKTL